MAKVTIGLNKAGNSYQVVFSPNNGNIIDFKSQEEMFVWVVAGTSGNITAPSGTQIRKVAIGMGHTSGGAPTISFGAQPQKMPIIGWETVFDQDPAAKSAVTFPYTAVLSYGNSTYKSTDPEIVNDPPTGTGGADPEIVRSPPGDS